MFNLFRVFMLHLFFRFIYITFMLFCSKPTSNTHFPNTITTTTNLSQTSLIILQTHHKHTPNLLHTYYKTYYKPITNLLQQHTLFQTYSIPITNLLHTPITTHTATSHHTTVPLPSIQQICKFMQILLKYDHKQISL